MNVDQTIARNSNDVDVMEKDPSDKVEELCRGMASRFSPFSNFPSYIQPEMPSTIANPDLPAPPSGKYPAKSHCRRVAKWIAQNGGPASGVIYLEGRDTVMTEASLPNEICWLFDNKSSIQIGS